jgi:hypothetical protein
MYCFEREKKESPFIEGRIKKQQQPQTSSGGSNRERTIPQHEMALNYDDKHTQNTCSPSFGTMAHGLESLKP